MQIQIEGGGYVNAWHIVYSEAAITTPESAPGAEDAVCRVLFYYDPADIGTYASAQIAFELAQRTDETEAECLAAVQLILDRVWEAAGGGNFTGIVPGEQIANDTIDETEPDPGP
jgi:hypothetical protein